MAQVTSYASVNDPGARFERCVDESLAILRKAADEWALGHPEQPPSSEVLEQIIRVFEREHFLRRGLGKL
jgi:hypothetical protein